MFEEFMRTTGDDEKATHMALSIIENYVEEGTYERTQRSKAVMQRVWLYGWDAEKCAS